MILYTNRGSELIVGKVETKAEQLFWLFQLQPPQTSFLLIPLQLSIWDIIVIIFSSQKLFLSHWSFPSTSWSPRAL